MLSRWTLTRASGAGAVAGLIALVLWPLQARWESLTAPYLIVLAATALCGLSILWITCLDLVAHRRGPALRPVRGFDFALGALLAISALLQLHSFL